MNKIQEIRLYMGLNISEIGSILKVTRPIIYGLINGEKLKLKENQNRLDRLYYFCKKWRAFEAGRFAGFQYKKINGDKNLLDLLTSNVFDKKVEKLINKTMSKIKDILIKKKKERKAHELLRKNHGFNPINKEERKQLIRRLTRTIS
ncbi:hypothetical protein KY314_02915 [Candidatus Woesearchaeota archaeon]|nr:hypothetical protein [Candidatus Woesearchaeota archaeon]